MEISRSDQVRPSWDEYFIGVAESVKARGDCLRDQVGAVLVEDATHRIIATGYNGSPPGGPSCLAGECPRCLSDAPSGSSYEGCIEVHAERNCLEYAIEYFPHNNIWTDCTLYLTREPCVECSPYLFELGVGRIVYRTKTYWDYPLGPWTYEYEEI